MSGGFQTQVNTQPAPAVAGDFCDANPRFTVDAGAGAIVAGSLGVYVARFAWLSYAEVDGNSAPAIANNFGSGPVDGFVHREQHGLITTYLADASLQVPEGFLVTLFSGGGFWVTNDGAAEALKGMKAYANFADGKITFAATGSAAGGGSATGTIAAGLVDFTASINDNVLDVSAVSSGTIEVGTIISGTGVASGTQIVAQLSGTAGGVGTYALSIPEQTVTSESMTGAYGTFTAASGLSGTFGVGDTLSGTGVTAGATITALGTGQGGLGTYIVSPSQTVSSETITAGAINVETKWYCMSPGLPGELVKISDHPLG